MKLLPVLFNEDIIHLDISGDACHSDNEPVSTSLENNFHRNINSAKQLLTTRLLSTIENYCLESS